MTSQLKTLLLMAGLSAVLIVMGSALGGRQGILIALVFAVIMNIGSFWFSDKIVLSMYRAQELSPEDAPMVHRMVEELAQRAGACSSSPRRLPTPSPRDVTPSTASLP